MTLTKPIWLDRQSGRVRVIDQRVLPHQERIIDLKSADDAIHAIRDMVVRGAPLIGITAAYGVYLALRNRGPRPAAGFLAAEAERVKAARPTAVNLAWAVDRVLDRLDGMTDVDQMCEAARREADAIFQLEAERCRRIGEHGLTLIEKISAAAGGHRVNVLTHCNAGWLACGQYGTATAPIYAAAEKGIDIHVWVDETRPLNQGARLTAWELQQKEVPHTIVTDNAGGHLMQHGMVDLVIVGTDRTACSGDVANKIVTYLKALAARDNGVPFYVALPSSTFDWQIRDGIREIPIEERDPDEVRFVQGDDDGRLTRVLIGPEDSPAANFAFDVTPARLVSGFITERGICQASEASIRAMFDDN
jgi:methylthioribose-1-phosphate isomerase